MSNKQNTIKIMAWNANGLLKHKNELEVILKQKQIDICLISETHLTNHMYASFKNYKMYCANHPQNNARGGSAVIIRKSIDHYEEEIISSEEFQAATVTININESDISVTSIYSPPKHNIKMEKYIELFQKHNGRFVIGGDFNAKNVLWGSRLTTTKGRELWKAANQTGCNIITTGNPTYWPTDTAKIPDLIDFFVTRQIPLIKMHIEDGTELNSDHSPIYLLINGYLTMEDKPPYLSNKFTDWNYFKLKIENEIDLFETIQSIEDIETESAEFTTIIQQAAWMSTPPTRTKLFQQTFPKEILELLSKKRKIRKKWQVTRYPPLRTQLNQLTKILSDKMKEFKNNIFQTNLQNLTAEKVTDYSLWKTASHMKRPKRHNPPIKKHNGAWAKSNCEKAALFAQHLQKTFQPYDSKVEFNVPATVQESIDIKDVSFTEIVDEIQKLKSKKSPGYDLITSEVLKNLPPKALQKLTVIINSCFRYEYVPLCWKVSEIIMIPKPGKDPTKVDSYRPISLLPVIGKLFEKLFSKRLKELINSKQLLPTHQFGFREKHSTTDQVHRIVHTIEETLEKKKVCSAIFLDVAQAFDKVWHEGLVYKLKMQLPIQYTSLLTSYINNRFFRIKQEQDFSDLRKIEAGVPQGSILGPTLYLLYTVDIPEPNEGKVATFADDTCILAVGNNEIESSSKLQKAVDQILKWTNSWRIQLNESKSTHINFTNKTISYKPITIENTIVPYANTAKYLGMTLDAKLKWKEHIKIKAVETNLKFRKMYWLIGRKSILSIENKLLIYNQVLKPIWTYGIQLWGCASTKNIEIIQKVQNNILRNIVNAPWYIRNDDLHRDLGVKKVADIIRHFASKHIERLQHHINPEASILSNEQIYSRRLKRTKPHDLARNVI